jgi:hypothetical protein
MTTRSRLVSKARSIAALIAIAVLASSCVTTSTVMRSWVGKSETELLTEWGAPYASQKLNDGRTVHTWRTIWGKRENFRTCLQTFTISAGGEVEKWSYKGCARLQMKQ